MLTRVQAFGLGFLHLGVIFNCQKLIIIIINCLLVHVFSKRDLPQVLTLALVHLLWRLCKVSKKEWQQKQPSTGHQPVHQQRTTNGEGKAGSDQTEKMIGWIELCTSALETETKRCHYFPGILYNFWSISCNSERKKKWDKVTKMSFIFIFWVCYHYFRKSTHNQICVWLRKKLTEKFNRVYTETGKKNSITFNPIPWP